MFNKFSQRFFRYLILFLITANLFGSVTTYAAEQEVYLAKEPLPKIVARFREQGWDEEKIIKGLKSTLPKITPKLAKEKFNIEWIDNSLRGYPVESKVSMDLIAAIRAGNNKRYLANGLDKYPAVVVCSMEQVGFGLFALEEIKEGTVIAEYTGKPTQDINSLNDKTYVDSDNGIDARFAGNASRFANHLLSRQDLAFYGYEVPRYWFGFRSMLEDDVAVANVSLQPFGTEDDKHSALVSIKDIKAYEQIGFDYSESYGYEDSPWPDEPCLFDRNGEIISQEGYRVINKGVVFVDNAINRRYLLPPMPINKLQEFPKGAKIVDDYMVLQEDTWRKIFIVDLKEWESQLAKPRNRLTIPCYYVYDVKEHIKLLKDFAVYKISEADRTKILKVARYSDHGYVKANQLLDELRRRIYSGKETDMKRDEL
jgi:hypothetical protein